MTKVLNLDALETAIEKSIIVDGKEYFLKPFSVEEFVNQLREIEEVSGRTDMSTADIFEASIRILHRGFPDFPEDRLRKLNTAQIDALMAFVRGEMDDDIQKAAEAVEKEDAPGN